MHVPTQTVRCPPAPRDLLRTWEDKKGDGEKLHKHAKREEKKKISIQGELKERRLEVGGVNNRYA